MSLSPWSAALRSRHEKPRSLELIGMSDDNQITRKISNIFLPSRPLRSSFQRQKEPKEPRILPRRRMAMSEITPPDLSLLHVPSKHRIFGRSVSSVSPPTIFVENDSSDDSPMDIMFKLKKSDSTPHCDQLLHSTASFKLIKKCDSTASISSTESCDWDERKRTISANIKRKLGSVAKRPSGDASAGVNMKESLLCQFPDGTEEITCAQKGRTLREMLSPIFDKRNMSMDEFVVFLEASNTPLNYSFDTVHFAGQTLQIKGDHYDATNEFTYSTRDNSPKTKQRTTDSFSRSLHDDMPDSPQNLSISGSLKKSNSLEFDEISSIRRSHTDGDTSDHGVTKAKSISEQLERLKFNSNVQLPPLEFQDWTDFIPASRLEELTKQEKDQQHQIWELITTEHSYLCKVSVVVNTLLSALRQLQNEHFLIKISEKDVFLNIEDIQDIHMSFWRGCLVPLMQEAKDLGEPLNPDKLTEADSLSGVRLFDEELNPLFDYCIKYTECRSYIKVQQKNSDFKEFINWCTTQLRANFDKLGFYDMLIKPIQRIQQYHYILHNIMRNTSDEDVKTNLGHFYDKVKRFGDQLNTRKEEKEEEQKIEGIKERLDGYNVVSTSGNSSDQINQVLSQYNKFDLAERVPLLGKQRKFLHETQCKMTTPTDSKAADLALFLFSDMMLITKPYKGSKKKCRIIKQPLTLDKVVIEELKDAHHTSLVIYLNEYRSAVDMFLLQCANQESHTTLLNAVKHAKDNYQRDKCNYYSELDGSKSVSTTSVNSTNSAFLVSPPNHRHQSCSITRSSSEHYPPTRRIITEPSTSVARAQSMPASNEKRVLLVEQNNNLAASSASSSASTSSASICDTSGSGISIDSSAKSITLSGIKESDKGMEDKLQEDSDEATIKHETKKFEDSFISDNLTREFNGKLDMTKNIGDTVLTTNESEYYSKTDDIYSLNLELDKS